MAVRTYRLVRWCEDGRTRYVVVSLSPLDADLYDVIAAFDRRDHALRYLDDLRDRLEVLERAGLG